MSNPAQQEQRAAQLTQERAAAEQAKSLADHPYLNRCLDELEREYVTRWRNGTDLSPAAREALWSALQGALQFRQHLRTQISSGQVAHAAIERMTKTAR